MPNLIKTSVLAFSLLVGSFAQAEETITDASYFVGTWKLIAARPKLDQDTQAGDKKLKDTPFSYLAEGSKKKINETWKFSGDGSFELTSDDHRASSTITTKSTFIVENNTLKIGKVGRPGKFYNYKVHQRDGNDMILKGGMEGFYIFKKQ